MYDKFLRVDIDRDLNEITKLINTYMKRTYIQDIERELEDCTRKCDVQGCKEVQLLRALSAFMPQEQQKDITKLTEMLHYNEIITEMMPKLIVRDNRRGSSQEDQIKENVVRLLLYKILLTMKNR